MLWLFQKCFYMLCLFKDVLLRYECLKDIIKMCTVMVWVRVKLYSIWEEIFFVWKIVAVIFCSYLHRLHRSPKNTPRELLLKSERMSRLSPAAQKLIKSSVKVSSLTDSTLRASYSTPSPYAKRATPKTPYGRIKTPIGRVKTPGSTAGSCEGSSITDDLLQLPNTWTMFGGG